MPVRHSVIVAGLISTLAPWCAAWSRATCDPPPPTPPVELGAPVERSGRRPGFFDDDLTPGEHPRIAEENARRREADLEARRKRLRERPAARPGRTAAPAADREGPGGADPDRAAERPYRGFSERDEDERTSRAALARRVSIVARRRPLNEVVDELRASTGVVIEYDPAALKQLGMVGDEPASVEARDLPLADVLAVLLEPFELTWVVRENGIQLTDKMAAGDTLNVRLYAVADLIGQAVDASPAEAADDLAIYITSFVEPDSWEWNGGRAQLTYLPSARAFAVAQTEHVHDRLERALAVFARVQRETARRNARRNPAERNGIDAAAVGPVKSPAPAVPAEARRLVPVAAASSLLVRLPVECADQIRREIELRMVDVPLEAALQRLGDAAGLPIELDAAQTLERVVDPSLPVSLAARDRPILDVLLSLLHRHGLQATVRGRSVIVGRVPAVRADAADSTTSAADREISSTAAGQPTPSDERITPAVTAAIVRGR